MNLGKCVAISFMKVCAMLSLYPQATLEKLCDMRAAVTHLLDQEMQREKDTCAEATQLVRNEEGFLLWVAPVSATALTPRFSVCYPYTLGGEKALNDTTKGARPDKSIQSICDSMASGWEDAYFVAREG